MPFYEYQCKACGHALEAMQKVNDSPLKKCPDCGKSQLTRLMSAPVFRLKGAGWYETDFKGEQDKKKNLADRPEADAGGDDKAPAADAKSAEAGKDGAKPEKPVDAKAEEPAAKPEASTASVGSRPVSGAAKRGAAAPVRKPKRPPPKKTQKKVPARAKSRR